MSDTQRKARISNNGPCEAEQLWFEASDRFYTVLARQGQQAALQTAREVLQRLTEPQAAAKPAVSE